MKFLKVGENVLNLDQISRLQEDEVGLSCCAGLLGNESFSFSGKYEEVAQLLKSYTKCFEVSKSELIVLNKISTIEIYDEDMEVTFIDGDCYSYDLLDYEKVELLKLLSPHILQSTDDSEDTFDETLENSSEIEHESLGNMEIKDRLHKASTLGHRPPGISSKPKLKNVDGISWRPVLIGLAVVGIFLYWILFKK